MKNKSVSLKFLAVLLALATLLCTATAPQVFAVTDAERAAQLKEEISDLEDKIKENDAKIAELKKKANGQQEYIDELQSQIDTVQSKIDLMNEGIAAVQGDIDVIDGEIADINAEIEALESKIVQLDADIITKQQEIAAIYTLLGERIRALYMAGPTSQLELLLNDDSFEYETFLTRIELLNRISEHDDALVTDVYEAIDALHAMQEELKGMIGEKDAAIAELDVKKAELDAKKAEQVAARDAVQAEEDKIQDSLDVILDYVSSLEASSKEYQRINDNAESKIESYEKKIVALLSPEVSTGSGSASGFLWPVQYSNTYISSSYGTRTLNGRTKMHNGTDICISGGTYGAKISCAADGKVVAAYKSGYNGGYGLYVVVDHGNGVQTYYCHCSSVSVSKGDTVTRGQKLGAIGSTGYSTGPHLHFAVLVNGSFRNPLNYVNKPSDCRVTG